MTRLLRRLGGTCVAHPWRVVAAWLLAATAATVLGLTVGSPYSQEKSLPGTEVAAADVRFAQHFPAAGDESAEVLLVGQAPASVRAAMPAAARAIARLPHVANAGASTVRWSGDRRTAWLHVQYDETRNDVRSADLTRLEHAISGQPGVRGYVTGGLLSDVNMPSGSGLAEKVGVGLAIVVLLVAFGSVIAALMPVATAALAILTGLGLVKVLAGLYPVNASAPALATMLGLGAGIDYALFIVTRHREGLRQGLTPAAAAVAASAAAGTSVLWAGVTVVAAITGLAFAGIPLISSLGFAAAIVVALSVAVALTLLPALLALTGHRIDRLHVHPPRLRHRPPSAVPGWARWAHAIERRPGRYAAGSALLLVVLALPVGATRLGYPDNSSAAPGTEARLGFDAMSHAFGIGANGPLRLVVALPSPGAAGHVAADVRAALSTDRAVASTSALTISPDRSTGVMTITPREAPQSVTTADLVPRLRHDVLPPIAHATRTTMWLTGQPAGRYDVTQRVLDRLPFFVVAVLAVSFLLLMLVFRSVVVPIKAVLLNLLSIAAALGVVVAVFQWGWLRGVVGVPESIPVVDVMPMLLFAVVFGLSMDYEVFLLSRVREEWVLGQDSRGSVVRGLTKTARVISAAAAIMVAVFLSFTLGSDVIVKMMGLGLAVAVLLDATVIRLVLVPATMSLLGDLNWWVPRWLDRLLPHVEVNAAVPVTPYAVIPGPAQTDADVLQSQPPTEAPIPRPTR